jgi:hypothetical protein
MADEPRRLRAPWSIRDMGHCFTVETADGIGLANVPYVYRPESVGTNSDRVLTRDEARRVAANIARLPDLLARR